MTQEEKEIKQETFIEWTTFIEDRVNEWSTTAPKEIVKNLDYSPESLKVIEQYILSKYTKETLGNSENKIEIDALVSYYGETLRRNIPNSIWHIELDDETSVDFNTPSVKAPIGPQLGLYYLLKRLVVKNKGTFLYDMYVKMLDMNKP